MLFVCAGLSRRLWLARDHRGAARCQVWRSDARCGSRSAERGARRDGGALSIRNVLKLKGGGGDLAGVWSSLWHSPSPDVAAVVAVGLCLGGCRASRAHQKGRLAQKGGWRALMARFAAQMPISSPGRSAENRWPDARPQLGPAVAAGLSLCRSESFTLSV